MVNDSTHLRNPMPDVTDEGLRIYVSLLERRLLLLESLNVRFRACLELSTGEPWDSDEIANFSAEMLDEVVAQNMARGLKISIQDARDRVRVNKALANPGSAGDQVKSPTDSQG